MKTVKTKEIIATASPQTITDTLVALTNEITLGDNDKVMLYVTWTVKNAKAFLHLTIFSSPIKEGTNKFFHTETTVSNTINYIFPTKYVFKAVDVSGNALAVNDVARYAVPLAIGEGKWKFSIRGSATSNSNLSAGTLSLLADVSSLGQ